MNAHCPECHGGLGELVEKCKRDGDAVADFECTTCGYEWSVSL